MKQDKAETAIRILKNLVTLQVYSSDTRDLKIPGNILFVYHVSFVSHVYRVLLCPPQGRI